MPTVSLMGFVRVLMTVVLASGVAATSADRRLSAQSGTPDVSYEEFVKLSPDARRDQFARLTAEQKAHIKRTHAERWLAANRDRLSAEQIAVTTEAIAFVTPEIYLQPNDPEVAKQEEVVKQKLTCALGRAYARDALCLTCHVLPRRESEIGGARSMHGSPGSWNAFWADCRGRATA